MARGVCSCTRWRARAYGVQRPGALDVGSTPACRRLVNLPGPSLRRTLPMRGRLGATSLSPMSSATTIVLFDVLLTEVLSFRAARTGFLGPPLSPKGAPGLFPVAPGALQLTTRLRR
jgi:hypothetical protein